MKGWEFTTTNVPLKIVEKPDPVATEGRVVIDVKAAGLCHSDVGALRDEKWLDIIEYTPIIMGHEVAGVISEVGEGVTDYQVGDRVGVCPVSKVGMGPGYGYDGGYADKVSAPAVDLVPIPDNVSFAQAAAGTDAGMTSYHAMFRRGEAKPGMKVGIIGIGGLGQIAARAAVVKGMDVYAVDLSPKARELAREIGVKEVYENVTDLAEVAPELIVDYAGFGTTTADALDVVAQGGKVVLVGMGKLESTINTDSLILKRADLLGSVGGDGDDIAEVYKLFASGDIDPVLTKITFDEIGEGLGRLERHEISGRLVAIMD
ncbi:zinc-binding dehydrogenase [Oceanobacillus halophilus]|uniref:Alcohol dehydrogenase n=1 Tax=Oceanobacillus halophilus TaxID=930130 RepID=A0A495A470_9BACI|nr:zinc-binding dehydrogenase [Oceanobacillus halophilus]RKQ33976.1 alcohol dehydrogenase [Oceanobacillus halophilus]